MPTIDNPAHYERSSFIAPGRADEFFKRLDLDEAELYTGSTESPTGHVMLVRITSDMIAEYVATAGDPWMSERRNFSPGWYIVREDDNGLVWGIGYGACEAHGEPCEGGIAEMAARADYAEAAQIYDAWLNSSAFGEM